MWSFFHLTLFVSPMNCAGLACEFCIQDEYNKEDRYLSGSDEWHYTFPCQWEEGFIQRAFVLQLKQIGCIFKKKIESFYFGNF